MHSTHFSDGYMMSNKNMVKWIAGQKPAGITGVKKRNTTIDNAPFPLYV